MKPTFLSVEQALDLHEAGKLAEAENAYRRILESQPGCADALNLLGVLLNDKKDCEEAEILLRQAIAINKRAAPYHNNLGNVYLAQKRRDLAEKCYRKALKLQPEYADALVNLGVLFAEDDKLAESEKCYRKALALEPNRPDIHDGLGVLLAATDRVDEAMEHYGEALRIKPGFVPARVHLAGIYKTRRNTQKVIEIGFAVLKEDPRNIPMLITLGNAYAEMDRFDDASVFYRQALNVDPESGDAHLNLASMLRQQGKSAEARTHFRKAVQIDPGKLTARLGSCIGQIPLLHRSTNELIQTRENYRKELETFCGDIDLDNPHTRNQAPGLVGYCQPFFLTYQGENDRELQTTYGDLMSKVQAACFPQYAEKPPMPPTAPGEPLRIGILSGFYHYHSNWKIPIKGWVENLNREEFQLYGYYTGTREDEQTEIARKSFHRFTEGISLTDAEWCDTIRRDRLHVLIIPEVGMDRQTLRLAALRLAPVQCTSWGHPDTSGLPTIDYYLSSDLMEPEDGQEHYREKLVRLPNLSIYYEPVEVEYVSPSRADYGLRDDCPLFICTQSLFKYLPQYDEVFPRIAKEVGNCQFAFLGYHRSPILGKRFLHRLETAFANFDLRMDDYVKMLPNLKPPYYRALNRLADVFLDSIGWSGCNSTIEALGCDLPVVTMPGRLMRGRHSHAILKMIGLDETEGRDMDEYVAIAARMVKEPEWRREVSEKIARTKHMAYRDTECIRALEEFLRQTVARFQTDGENA
jgi:predicted O-linked N-acetylglucosamine transferase (SPINDLY family)